MPMKGGGHENSFAVEESKNIFIKEVNMKKFLFMVLIVAFVCTASTVYAAQKAPLGNGNLALKLDWIKFTDGWLKDRGADSAFYIGLEGYGMLAPNWYLGLESGYAQPKGTESGYVETKLTYIPVELNVKYAGEVAQNVVIDAGAGLSYNYSKIQLAGLSSDSKWLFGGQFFLDLNYTIDQFFIGISGKYQITQKFKDAYDFNANNWRLGGQIGVMF
jgi:hypothetical protein